MKRVFLYGYPVAHSISPEMHNAAFRSLGLDWRYELMPTRDDQLAQAIAHLYADDCVGANVTIPHKVNVINYLDQLTERARRIGAVNTIVKRNGRLIGDNTDGVGFMQALMQERVDLANANAVILGAGGAARAVAFALADVDVRRIAVINRTRTRALALVHALREHYPQLDATVSNSEDIKGAGVIVNATCIGMTPDTLGSPLPRGTGIAPNAVAFDLVYRPRRTRFLIACERSGAKTIGGLGMLVYQGAAALELWLGASPPVQAMFRAAERALAVLEQHETSVVG